MPDIYDQHAAAFAQVSAFVVMRDGEKVATVAFKFPRDGAGRLYAYVHWLGIHMVRAYAGGYGYDKRTAAAEYAARAMPTAAKAYGPENDHPDVSLYDAFRAALLLGDGYDWSRNLEKAGFTVLQAV